MEREREEEWRFHLESRVDALMATGLDRASAEQQARIEFGPPIKWKEESREAAGLAVVDALRRDCAYALRQSRRSPLFATLVVVTLAVGIGATSAMFSIVDAVLLRPLQFPGADRASEVWMRAAGGAGAQPGVSGFAFPAVRDGLAGAAVIEGYRFGSGTITGGTEPVIVSVPEVGPGLLPIVGASPLIGRLFGPDDTAPGSRSVLISERLWASQFGRDPAVLGRQLAIDGERHTVIGVLPDRVRYPEARAAVWKPLDAPSASQTRRRIQTIVIRRPDITIDELRARLAAITLSLRSQGTLPEGASLILDDVVQARVSRNEGRPLWTLLGAVGLVLLVACANVMNLLLVRASNRRGELAVQSALGADRLALMRQSLVEAAILAGAGTLAGLALAAAFIRVVTVIIPPQLDFLVSRSPDLNWRVIGAASGVALTVALVASLVPAWRSTRIDPIDAMKWPSRSIAGSRDEGWQGAMLAVQIATLLVLLGGTGLLLRSFTKLTNVDPGYDGAGVVSVAVQMTSARYEEAGSALAAMQELERLVEDAGIGHATLTAGTPISFEIRPEGEGGTPVDATGMVLPWSPVSPDWFETLGIPLLEGRTFVAGDGPDAIIVNDRLARTFWSGTSAIGRRFRLGANEPWRTVVGVVGDVRMMGLDDPSGHGMEFYTPHLPARGVGYFSLIVRSTLPVRDVVARVKDALRAIDPDVPVVEAGSLRDELIGGLYRQRFVLHVSIAFATIAVLLAGVGIYAVAAYWVARRRRELAIRIALGAGRRHVAGRMLSRTAFVCGIGAILGAIASAASFRVLKSLLYDTSGIDPLVLGATATFMIALVAAACLGPVRAALSVDPLTILREQ